MSIARRTVVLLGLAAVAGGCRSEGHAQGRPRGGDDDGTGAAPLVERDIHEQRVDAGGVPLTGDLRVHISLRSPDQRLAHASGVVTIQCDRCAYGDDQARVLPDPAMRRRAPSQSQWLAGGLTIPRIALGTVRGSIRFKNGRGVIGIVADAGQGSQIRLAGSVDLADPLPASTADLQLAIKLAPAYARAHPRASTILSLLGPTDQDGAINIGLTGRLDHLRPVASHRRGAPPGAPAAEKAGSRRPQLSP